MIIYSIGHSNRNINEFLKLLKKYNIEILIDVRRFPKSRKFPWFNKENLEKVLEENKIKYFHFEELGGFRNEGYKNYVKTKEFKNALEKIIDLLKNNKVCIMCAEKNYKKCHRRFILEKLKKKGIKTYNII